MKRACVVTALCFISTAVMASPAFAAPARAAAHTCELVAPDVVAVDGMTDEWRASKAVQAGDKSDDASFSVRCAYDGERLYLVVSVRDDYVYRGKRPSPKTDDTLLLELAVAGGATSKTSTITVFPGKDQIAPAHLWGGKKLPADVMIEDTRQRQGWSVELAIPFGRIPGLGASTPGVSARIEYRDADFGARTEGRVSWDGTLELQASAELFGSFLEATKLGRNDIRLDQVANIDDQAGPERVVAGGAIVGVLAEGFTYMMLPVAAAKDVLEVKLVDLRGDGTMSIVALIRQHGNGGSRDLLTVWGMAGNGLERILAVEVRKELGGRVITNRWSLVSKGSRGPAGAKRGKRGADLVVEVSDADVSGWDEDSYGEVPAPDVPQILTPWAEQKAVVYRFEGNTAVGPEPATGGKATGKASVRRRP